MMETVLGIFDTVACKMVAARDFNFAARAGSAVVGLSTGGCGGELPEVEGVSSLELSFPKSMLISWMARTEGEAACVIAPESRFTGEGCLGRLDGLDWDTLK
jgi:hypothetical protein